MASLSSDKKGNRRVQFFGVDGNRKSVRLGKLSKKSADAIRVKIAAINAAAVSRTIWDRETAEWVGDLEVALYDKLAAVSLLPPRAKVEQYNLESFLDAYVARRSEVKASTRIVYGHTRRCLVGFFGPTKALADISLADADDWRRWLATKQKLAENTIRRRCAIARQFFRDAVRRRLMVENPFSDMKGVAIRANKSRDYFLSREDAAKVLDACPDAQWRAIFSLSRFGGLRCPSEHLALRWDDIDWPNNRMTVHSPKTERHEGKASRVVPLFAEVRRSLQKVWEESSPDAKYVITRYRDAGTNLRTQFERIIRRAGLKPWPKLFQNLRSTRETELARTHPLHVVCEWIGNSPAVATKHYLQVTDEDFTKALGESPTTAPDAVQSEAISGHLEQSGEDGERKFDGIDSHLDFSMGGTRLELVTSTV